MIDERAVLGALATVRDPELDEPITELGFVSAVRVDGAAVEVRLRLPTYFCAPNFAWMMASDAQRAVRRLPAAGAVRVMLEVHFASAQIDAGVEARRSFAAAFAGDADGDLDELRGLFLRKAFLARQHAACDPLLRAARDPGELARLTLDDLPPGVARDGYLARRAELGLDARPAAPLVVTPAGEPVAAGEIERHLALARAIRVSIEGNAGLCRGLLRTRYELREDVPA